MKHVVFAAIACAALFACEQKPAEHKAQNPAAEKKVEIKVTAPKEAVKGPTAAAPVAAPTSTTGEAK